MRTLGILIATLTTLIAPPAVAGPNPVLGTWVNPKHTVAVQTAAYEGGGLCGAIVRADLQAMADARDAGVPQLIGLQLLQD